MNFPKMASVDNTHRNDGDCQMKMSYIITTPFLPTLNSSTYRLAFAEAHSYVTLESYVVGTREFERVEAGQQRLGVRVVVPLAEYRRVGRTPILVGYYVLVLYIVFNRFRHTAPGVSSVDACNIRIGHYRFLIVSLLT